MTQQKLIQNRYQLIRELGRGDMSAVFQVADTHVSRKRLALKVALAPLHEEALNREYSALRKLRHPNLVEVYDYGFDEETSRHFFTSEYVEGDTLFDIAPRISSEELFRIIVQALQTLAFIHAKGFLHYDIKPENLLVMRGRDGDYLLKIIDFGLAGSMTRTQASIRGSLDYIAPEVLRGQSATQRSELYSFGQTLRAILAALPDEVMDSPQVMQIAALTGRLCAEDPGARYESAAEALASLGAASGQSLDAMPAHSAVASIFSDRLIGREGELRELTGHFEKIFLRKSPEDSGRGKSKIVLKRDGPGVQTHETNPLVVVTGEFGIGKTRLLEELRHHAQINHVHFIPTRFLERAPGLPPVFEFIERAMKLLPEGHAIRDELERELAGIREPYDMTRAVRGELALPHQARLKFLMRSVEFLIQESEEYPFVASFSDLQWGDPFTLEFINYLVRGVTDALSDGRRAPIMIVGSCRVEEMGGSPFQKLKNEMVEEDLLSETVLGPLVLEDLFSFLHSMLRTPEVPRELVERIYSNSRGNPFFITEILKMMCSEEILVFREGEWSVPEKALRSQVLEHAELPRSIEFVFKRQLEMLPRNALLVLRNLAVIRRPTDVVFLRAFPELADFDLEAVVKDLCERRILVEEDGKFWFSQIGMAKVIARALHEDERVRLHTIAAELLEELPEKDLEAYADLAHHSKASGNAEAAQKYTLLAGKLFAEAYENDKALAFYDDALEMVGTERRDLDIWTFIQEKRADLFRVLGRFDDALETLASVLDRFSELRITEERTARLLRSQGSILERLGRYTESREAYKEGLKTLGVYTRSSEKVQTLAALGRVSMYQGDYNDAMTHALDALKVLGESDEGLDHARVYSIIANTHYFLGNFKQALEFHARALDIRRERGTLYEQADSLNAIGLIRFSEARYSLAVESFKNVINITEKSGDIFGRAYSLVNLAETFFSLGMYAESDSHLEVAMEIGEKNDMKYVRSLCYILAGRHSMRSERNEEALEFFKKARGLYSPMGNRDGLCRISLTIAELEMARNRLDAVDGWLEDAGKLAEKLESKILLSRWHLLRGRLNFRKGAPPKDAIEDFNSGLALLQENLAPDLVIELNRELGDSYVTIRDMESAEKHHGIASRLVRDVAGRLEPEMANVFIKEHTERETGIRRAGPAQQKTEHTEERTTVSERNQEVIELLAEDNRRLREIIKLGTRLEPGLAWEDFLCAAFETLIDVTGALRVFYLRRTGKHPEVEFGLSYTGDVVRPEDADISLTLAERSMISGKPILSRDAARDSRFAKYASVTGFRIQSVMVMPFSLPGEDPCAIYLDHPYRRDAFHEDHIPLVEAVIGYLHLAADYQNWREGQSEEDTRRFTEDKFGGYNLDF